MASENNHEKWEEELAERRLLQRHQIALAGKAARNKKVSWIKATADRLRKETAQWHYRKRLEPPDIELAWIIHSQIAWKGPDAAPETLWEDLPETDPARILEAEKEGPDSGCPIPQETVLLLRNVLTELEAFGHDIKHELFSENWTPGSKGSNKGKGSVKKAKWSGFKTKTVLAGKPLCKSRLLSDFFEMKT